jgi:hypothetical protein
MGRARDSGTRGKLSGTGRDGTGMTGSGDVSRRVTLFLSARVIRSPELQPRRQIERDASCSGRRGSPMPTPAYSTGRPVRSRRPRASARPRRASRARPVRRARQDGNRNFCCTLRYRRRRGLRRGRGAAVLHRAPAWRDPRRRPPQRPGEHPQPRRRARRQRHHHLTAHPRRTGHACHVGRAADHRLATPAPPPGTSYQPPGRPATSASRGRPRQPRLARRSSRHSTGRSWASPSWRDKG